MTFLFQKTGEGWREKDTKTPFVLTWGALAKIIMSFMKVHRKKWKKPTKRMDRQEKKITFPLCLRFMPPLTRDETAKEGWGLLQEASWGFCAKQTGTRETIQPFLCFLHSLKQRTFDHSTMTGVFPHYTVHHDIKKKMKKRLRKITEMRTTPFE